jgi:hypothetical protein
MAPALSDSPVSMAPKASNRTPTLIGTAGGAPPARRSWRAATGGSAVSGIVSSGGAETVSGGVISAATVSEDIRIVAPAEASSPTALVAEAPPPAGEENVFVAVVGTPARIGVKAPPLMAPPEEIPLVSSTPWTCRGNQAGRIIQCPAETRTDSPDSFRHSYSVQSSHAFYGTYFSGASGE